MFFSTILAGLACSGQPQFLAQLVDIIDNESTFIYHLPIFHNVHSWGHYLTTAKEFLKKKTKSNIL